MPYTFGPWRYSQHDLRGHSCAECAVPATVSIESYRNYGIADEIEWVTSARYFCEEHRDFADDLVTEVLGDRARRLLRATVLAQ